MGNESALQDCEGYTRWGGKARQGGEGRLDWVGMGGALPKSCEVLRNCMFKSVSGGAHL